MSVDTWRDLSKRLTATQILLENTTNEELKRFLLNEKKEVLDKMDAIIKAGNGLVL